MASTNQLLIQARQLFDDGNLAGAHCLLVDILRLDPDNQVAWLLFTHTCQDRRSRSAALAAMLRRFPNHPQAQAEWERLNLAAGSQPLPSLSPPVLVDARQEMPAGAHHPPVVLPTPSRVPAFQAASTAPGYLAPDVPGTPLADRPAEPSRRTGIPLAGYLAALAGIGLAGILLLVVLLAWWGVGLYLGLRSSYNQSLQKEHSLGQQNLALQAQYSALQRQAGSLQDFSQQLWGQHQRLGEQYQGLARDFKDQSTQNEQLRLERDNLHAQYNQLNAQYMHLNLQYNDMVGRYNQVNQQYTALDTVALRPPYIYIAGREINMWFYLLDGTLWKWHTQFATLEDDLQRGYQRRQSLPRMALHRYYLPSKTSAPLSSDPTPVTDFTVFVDSSSFADVIPNLYYRSGNADNFIREAWHIVAQLSNYTSEDGEVPRYPTETLLAGGGDCEDTAILLASMLMAAPVNWEVNLVYLDANNLYDPQWHNHVIVHIHTDQRDYLIETTSKRTMEPYPAQVVGWYLPVR